ncbi:Protein-S-isoprenylcysteine O-methyltransferase [Toxocara canis]|uniref:Protein-S-isoprenylcysteine O-methyltransferase n=2 Tax=Toxocara canis TaxID=6265 RepID=A0A0B2V6E5_TOXCA|nr:Protein-S-isoprenylcysteine O-methyltransferase [Toxocara canis]KHN77113.1 Protein-S-isoprenylcysteine O-methyltransferase [Toxocara canis]VDM38865.1 unnamed protein product [Toxocara canis]
MMKATKLGSLVAQLRDDVELRCSLNSALGSIVLLSLTSFFLQHRFSALLLIALFSSLLSLAVYGRQQFWNALQASLLGSVFSLSLLYAIRTDCTTTALIFTNYALSMAFFHYSEFIATALTNRRNLNSSSYLLDHSLAYWIAALTSWLEFGVESYAFPSMKLVWMSRLGIVMVIFGEILRKLAMMHAQGGFTHLVALERRPEHVLVTNGVYGLVRHPGYLGWLVWCVGTQVLLCNPICTLVYAFVAWNFFNDRIYWEEQYLVAFFGSQYLVYQQRVPTGIPFIKGFHTY